jgi:hypothetical protein
MAPMEAMAGFQRRVVEIAKIKKPKILVITMNGLPAEELKECRCDDCGAALPDGTQATAISVWRGTWEPNEWESEFRQ